MDICPWPLTFLQPQQRLGETLRPSCLRYRLVGELSVLPSSLGSSVALTSDEAKTRMSKKSEHLVREISSLIETTESLREVLSRYQQANDNLAKRVGQGESVLEAFDGLDGAMQGQRELTEKLEEFEAVRHQVRVALFASATAQGVSLSELGRRLGISRQLASRLAAEVGDVDA